jgi:hypothetical protein
VRQPPTYEDELGCRHCTYLADLLASADYFRGSVAAFRARRMPARRENNEEFHLWGFGGRFLEEGVTDVPTSWATLEKGSG